MLVTLMIEWDAPSGAVLYQQVDFKGQPSKGDLFMDKRGFTWELESLRWTPNGNILADINCETSELGWVFVGEGASKEDAWEDFQREVPEIVEKGGWHWAHGTDLLFPDSSVEGEEFDEFWTKLNYVPPALPV